MEYAVSDMLAKRTVSLSRIIIILFLLIGLSLLFLVLILLFSGAMLLVGR